MAKTHILAALVNPYILSVLFIRAPAPRKPIPVTIAERRGSGFAGAISKAAIPRAQEPVETKTNVPNPTGFLETCLSIPNKKDIKKITRNLNIIADTILDEFFVDYFSNIICGPKYDYSWEES